MVVKRCPLIPFLEIRQPLKNTVTVHSQPRTCPQYADKVTMSQAELWARGQKPGKARIHTSS